MQTNPENRETWAEFVARLGITIESRRYKPSADRVAAWGEGARHFRVTLKRPGSICISVPFSQGSAWDTDPTAEEVMDCLASDSALVENTKDFADWCAETGSNEDSRKDYASYQSCKRQQDAFKVFLGPDEYRRALWSTESL